LQHSAYMSINAMTFNIMPFSITAIDIKGLFATLSICHSGFMTLRINNTQHSEIQPSISLKGLFATLSVSVTQHNDIQHKAIQHGGNRHKGLVCNTQHKCHSGYMTLSINNLQHNEIQPSISLKGLFATLSVCVTQCNDIQHNTQSA
jgi:hypothetical protein